MLLKMSPASSLLLATLCVLIVMPCQNESFEIRDTLDNVKDKVLEPIKSIIPGKETESKEEASQAKEHGNFDFIGRDIIRETSKKVRRLTDKVKTTFSKFTQGLDLNNTLSTGTLSSFKQSIQAIYPGTKWCGDGNIASSVSELGKFSGADRCCRAHDLCPDNMEADSTKYDLVNTGLFTRSHCSCDREFYDCLKADKSVVADSIGYTYFTILGPQCYQKEYPVVDCLEERKGKCEKYLVDPDEEKKYQWFDSPVF